MVHVNKKIPYYNSVKSQVYKFKKQYSCAKVFSLGKSVGGRRIYCLGIGSLRQSVLYVGGIHASEWLTINALLTFGEEVAQRCETDKSFSQRLEQRGIMIIPCLNPDGVEIAVSSKGELSRYNANQNGVDLNHNFDAGFEKSKKLELKSGITSPSFKQYGGEYPESEPETHALCTLCNLFEPQIAYALHSQGEEIYYSYENHTPKQSEQMAKSLSRVSGYKLVKQTGLCSHAGFKDWFILKKHRPAFTIEMGKGQNPLPLCDFEKTYKKLRALLWQSIVL